ncbi:hypothetical protein JCM3765_004829 [Sporobolomyces pararoseus]
MTRNPLAPSTFDSSGPHLVKKTNEEALQLVKQIHEKFNNHHWSAGDKEAIRLKSWYGAARLFARDNMMHAVGVLCNPQDYDEYLCFEEKYDLMIGHLKDLVAQAGAGELYDEPIKLPCIDSYYDFTVERLCKEGAKSYSFMMVDYQLFKLEKTILGNAMSPTTQQAHQFMVDYHRAKFPELSDFVSQTRTTLKDCWNSKTAGEDRLAWQGNAVEELSKLLRYCQGTTYRREASGTGIKGEFLRIYKQLQSGKVSLVSLPILTRLWNSQRQGHHLASAAHSLSTRSIRSLTSRKLAIYQGGSQTSRLRF